MKEYILKPITTPPTVALTPNPDKSAVARNLPPRQPLPTAVIDPAKPVLKLGLDVHLEFIMAVPQKDHASPHAPRKFTRAQLVAQVRKWVAEGFQVFCVQESCGLDSAASGFFRSLADWIPPRPGFSGVLRIGFRCIRVFQESCGLDSAESRLLGSRRSRLFPESGVFWGFLGRNPPCPAFWEGFYPGHGRVRTFGEDFFPHTAVGGVFKRHFLPDTTVSGCGVQLDMVHVAQPSTAAGSGSVSLPGPTVHWLRAARRRWNPQARTPALRFCPAVIGTVSSCTPQGGVLEGRKGAWRADGAADPLVRQRHRESGHLPPSRSKASAVRDKVSGLLACHFRSRSLPSFFSAQIIRCIWTTRNSPGLSRCSNSRNASVTDWSPFKWQTVTHCLLRHCSTVKNPCAIIKERALAA